jgi:hypothetical protein
MASVGCVSFSCVDCQYFTEGNGPSREITYLDCDRVGELLPCFLGLLEPPDDIEEGSSTPEVLLLQS